MSLLHKTPLLKYTPEIPAVAGRPAYTFTELIYAGGGGVSVDAAGSGYWSMPYIDALGHVSSIGSSNAPASGGSTGAPMWRSVLRSVPAVLGSPSYPARIDASSSIGWNSGARSIEPLPANGYFEFRLPNSLLAIVAGISGSEFNYGYGQASHAIVFRESGMTPISRGVNLAAPVALVPGALVRFERKNGAIKAFVNDALFYAFEVPVTTQAYAAVSLYGMSDHITDSVIVALNGGVDGVIPAPVGRSGQGAYADAMGRTPPMTLSAELRRAHAVDGTVPAPAGVASEGSYCRVIGRTPAMRMTGRLGSPEAEESGVLGFVPNVLVTARCLNGGIGGVSSSFKPPTGALSEGPYAFVDGVWGGHYTMTSWGEYLGPNLADGGDPVYAADFGILNNAVLIAVYDGVSITDSLELILLINLEAYEFVGVGDKNTLAGVIQLLARERVAINSGTSTAKREAIQYAVNAVSGAIASYDGFGFLQFARCNGETFAIRKDGMYRLGRNGSETINAAVDFGGFEFGTSQAKRMAHIYAGANTDGKVYVRIAGDDGVERSYEAVDHGSELRATTAKGISSRHWRLKLEITDATFADVDSIEFDVGVSQRRLQGR